MRIQQLIVVDQKGSTSELNCTTHAIKTSDSILRQIWQRYVQVGVPISSESTKRVPLVPRNIGFVISALRGVGYDAKVV